MDPHLDQAESAQPLRISENVKEQTLWLVCAGGPDGSVGGFPFLDVFGLNGEGYEQGELFGHVG